jgi:glycosyltransferase involved in cell wall biosynthesis
VLDRNWKHFPENFSKSPNELDSFLEAWMRRSINVVAISQSVADDIEERWPELAAKVHAIPLAASANLDRATWEHAQDTQGPDHCFYYPATVSPHKGHAVLLAAVRILRERGLRFRVVLSGHNSDTLAATVESGTVSGLGYADRATVKRTYLQASTVVLPSLYEGFGLPLAEAMAHGAFVICTDLPAYREQIVRLDAGQFASVVPVGDTGALANAMAARVAIGQPTWSDREKIAQSALRWTWCDVAKAYQKVLSEIW